MDITAAIRDGALDDAIAALSDELRTQPLDRDRRGLLFELLIVAGELERADKQLGVLEQQHPDAAPSVALWRQLVRAAQWREDVFASGRVPAFLSEPDERMRAVLAGLTALREGDETQARACLARAEEHRVPTPGRHADQGFDDLRDMDDRLGPVFELLTSTGKYYWVAPETVRSVCFEPRERPRDLAWRQAEVEIEGGPTGVVYLPAVYPGAADMTTSQKLGRETDWVGDDGQAVRGLGQRLWLVGAEGLPIHTLTELSFERPQEAGA